MATIQRITKEQDIYATIDCCRNGIFNQALNTDDWLKKISCKFAENALVIAYCAGMEIAGFSAFYCNDVVGKIAFLSMIVIRNEYQHRGIGKNLINSTIEECRNAGMNKLQLEVDKQNTNAIRFYEKFGFEIIGENDTSLFYSIDICNRA